MLIASPEFRCSNEILTIVAMLSGTSVPSDSTSGICRRLSFLSSVPNVWLRPNNQKKESDAAKAMLTVPDGDHLTLLNVYSNYMQSEFVSRLRGPLILLVSHCSCRLQRQTMGVEQLSLTAGPSSSRQRPKSATARHGEARYRPRIQYRSESVLYECAQSPRVWILHAGGT